MSKSKVPVGWSEATPNEFPWMVLFLLYNYTNGKFFTCGGTLVSDIHILTSPDCFYDMDQFNVNILSITLGAHDISANSSDRFRQIVQWSSISSYIRLNSSSVDNYYSIMTLKEHVTINGTVTFFIILIENKSKIRYTFQHFAICSVDRNFYLLFTYVRLRSASLSAVR